MVSVVRSPGVLPLTDKVCINCDKPGSVWMNWTIRSEVFLQVCNLPVLNIITQLLNVPGSVRVKLIVMLSLSDFFTSFLFLSRQQQEQDPTNLYISNLPLTMDEQELEAMLKPFGQVVSTRILRDTNGASRGVGFARWGSSICLRITRSTSVSRYHSLWIPLRVPNEVRDCSVRQGIRRPGKPLAFCPAQHKVFRPSRDP